MSAEKQNVPFIQRAVLIDDRRIELTGTLRCVERTVNRIFWLL